MGTAPKTAKLDRLAQGLHCVVSLEKSQLTSLTAEIGSFDRRGAVIRVFSRELRGRTIEAQDPVLLEVGLPPSSQFGKRAMRCMGTATHVSESTDGSLWLTVRFHQLYFQPVEPSSVDEVNDVSCEGDNRGQMAGGNLNMAGNGHQHVNSTKGNG